MSSTITKGNSRNDLARIYDRLRKRSYRRVESSGFLASEARRHETFLQGVLSALSAVEEAGLLAEPEPAVRRDFEPGNRVRIDRDFYYTTRDGKAANARRVEGTVARIIEGSGHVNVKLPSQVFDGEFPFLPSEIERVAI